jgi:hypothetical protein
MTFKLQNDFLIALMNSRKYLNSVFNMLKGKLLERKHLVIRKKSEVIQCRCFDGNKKNQKLEHLQTFQQYGELGDNEVMF